MTRARMLVSLKTARAHGSSARDMLALSHAIRGALGEPPSGRKLIPWSCVTTIGETFQLGAVVGSLTRFDDGDGHSTERARRLRKPTEW